MLRSHFALAGLTAAVLGLTIGCGDSGGNGGSGGSTGANLGAQPPAAPADGKAGDGSGKAFAVTKLYIGTTTRGGADSTTAWADYGYNLDNQITTTDFSKHCLANGGASPADTFKDGTNGIDNAFGKSLLPIIKSAAMGTDLQGQVNSAIAMGAFTVIVDMSDLGDNKDYNPLKSFLVAGKEGTPTGAPTSWKLVPELLAPGGTTPADSTVKFLSSYVNNNTWVSGTKGTVKLSLAIAGFAIDLNISSAVLTMQMDAGHTTATNGVIAGVLNTEDFINQLQSVLGAFDKDLCGGSMTAESILNRIRQASDIMADGTQDHSKTCDGISIGIGFDAAATTIAGVADKAAPQPDPCLATSSSTGTGTGSTTSSSSTGTGN